MNGRDLDFDTIDRFLKNEARGQLLPIDRSLAADALWRLRGCPILGTCGELTPTGDAYEAQSDTD